MRLICTRKWEQRPAAPTRKLPIAEGPTRHCRDHSHADHRAELPVREPPTHLDGAGSQPHADEVPPLQQGSEAALQGDDPPVHLLVEQVLQPLALRLPQEHLEGAGTGGRARQTLSEHPRS